MTERERTIQGMKRNIEAQLDEYAAAIAAYEAWMADWRARNAAPQPEEAQG